MAVPTTIDMVRDLLIGADSSIFTDEYIQRAIDGGMNAIDIAIMIAESSASLYANKQDLKVGPISLSNSQKAQAWMGIKKNLILRKQTGSGLPNDGSATSGGLAGLATGTLTGASIQTMEALATSADRTPNIFEVGQFDNPTTNPSGAETYDTER